jgi:addiction module RelE/StbE family toxin
MNAPYEIRYLSSAEKDLVEILRYIEKDNPSAARSMLEKFDVSISQLALQPFTGVVPKDERLRKLGYRMLIIGKYIVFYVVKAETVQIRRIIHGARRYDFLL